MLTPLPVVSAYYAAPIASFLTEDPDRILGVLAKAHGYALEPSQKQAWLLQIGILKSALNGCTGKIFLEFAVPRLGTRVDAVIVSGPAVFPIEFKCGDRRYRLADRYQAWDYALDLKNFHSESHEAVLLPILVATDAPEGDAAWLPAHKDGVFPPRQCNAGDLANVIAKGLSQATGQNIDADSWGRALYRPTPTIIEAARALYGRHAVQEIARHDAGAKNLAITSAAVDEIVEHSRERSLKSIVFVTGVPGAGKTLVGLNIATMRRKAGAAHAVFLSGNGPLVAVLREALIRDELSRRTGVRKGVIQQEVKPFIQNIHHFRDEGVRDNIAPPHDHVVIFDEAQRAWNHRQTASFMKRRKGIPNFGQSEPEFLLSYMNRRKDWAVVVCLVGGGQEINTGEAGIVEWISALEKFPEWMVHVSPNLSDSEYSAERPIARLAGVTTVVPDARLHLSTSMRSFRSEKVSGFVKALLDCDELSAKSLLEQVLRRFPIALSRDLHRAKAWIRTQARGNERYGLVASSTAERLKPHAIDVRVEVDPVHWFLNDRDDTRSSFYLEDAATEFQVQGLELDWICVSWDADLRLQRGQWHYHAFRGDGWTTIHDFDRRRYLLNAYRVLLTRARQGMVIFVPQGDIADKTRDSRFYDETYRYLLAVGLPEV